MKCHRVRAIVAAVIVGLGSASVPEAVASPHGGQTERKARSSRERPQQERAADDSKVTVRVTPLVRLDRGDARGLVMVPRHSDNRVLRVILESEDYYSRSDIQLDGEEAARSHNLYWRGLPPGIYWVTVEVYGSTGLRDSTYLGAPQAVGVSADRDLVPASDR
jgi:hypothetical protein